MSCYLGHLYTFCPSSPRRLHITFGFGLPSGFRENVLNNDHTHVNIARVGADNPMRSSVLKTQILC